MTTNLSIANLPNIRDEVARPVYNRDELSAGIIHVGVGNFHRAHQNIYLHQLFQMGLDRDWAILGAGVTKYDDAMRNKLASQDWLTTVVELEPEQLSATVTGVMIDYLEIDPQAIINAMARPEIRIVSLTVTEGGYFVDAQTGGFDHSHPDIIADAKNPESPNTVFGILIAALKLRKESSTQPFTIMTCDNLPENGHVAKQAVLGLAKKLDTALHDWISENVAFPNSMVDCITPATTEREINIVKNEFGINDSAPVVSEPFHQWVLEDNFTNGRPALEKVGVEFVNDVAPYELMKLRILNGGHASIAYLAALLDIYYVHDAMNNSIVAGYLEKLEHEEIIPTLQKTPGVSFEQYYDTVVKRFSNEAVGDTIPRLCFDGLNRQPKFILPVIDARLKKKQSIDGLALECALWCRYCYGTTDSGANIPANDNQWEHLNSLALQAKGEPAKWLEQGDVYGTLSEDEVFIQAFTKALNCLWSKGTEAAVAQYLS